MRQAVNPFLPLDEYIPDGEPHVFGDRIYLFGSHDKEDGETFCMLDYMGWSAPVTDLSDWTCSGSIYSAKQDPNYKEETRCHMYAPDVVQGNDGKWYVFYHRLTHLSDYSRQACAEEIKVLQDGSIPIVEITSCGLNGKMQHGSNKKKKTSEPYVGSEKGLQFIRGISNGTKIGYKYFDFTNCSSISVTTRGNGNGYFAISTSLGGIPIGKIELKPSAEWSTWIGQCQKLNGKQALFFTYVGKGKVEMLEFAFM